MRHGRVDPPLTDEELSNRNINLSTSVRFINDMTCLAAFSRSFSSLRFVYQNTRKESLLRALNDFGTFRCHDDNLDWSTGVVSWWVFGDVRGLCGL